MFQNNLGVALERSGFPVAAAKAYEAAISVDSNYHKASVALARVTQGGQEPEPGPVDLDTMAQQFQSVDDVKRHFGALKSEMLTKLFDLPAEAAGVDVSMVPALRLGSGMGC